jgi:hypothetical protein
MIKRIPLLSLFSTAHLEPGSYAATVTPAAGKARRANLKL